jgi:hypothetical protein
VNVSGSVQCPACGELAEPEQDGDLTYYACGCGNEFGYQRVVQEDSSCQLGVPEEIRKGYSLAHAAVLQGGPTPAEFNKALGPPETAVFLGYPVRRPEDN